ncbi:MAG: alkane 1-monooxygenase [Betaproteobacteria bacterium]|nr:alkane 1-monooxygenase [Betaproteobacteria bacterium]
MSVNTFPAPEVYRDPKRWAWWFSLGVPALIGLGPLLMLWQGDPLMLLWPLVFLYLAVPLADALLGEERSNPPESAVAQLEADAYYRFITYALVPVLWGAFVFAAWFVASHELPWYAWLAMVLNTGAVGGFGINLGHEMGHKHHRLERWLALVTLAPSGYGHFSIEHNRGHHAQVATPQDCASSRMGESIWRFVWREMPGGAVRAWRLESQRLRDQGLSVWSLQNQILQGLAITLALWAMLLLWLGWQVLLFLLAASIWTNFQLTSANYVEHYGLLRLLQSDGYYERCQPRHSWNSNHVASNWMLFHLQRHADHHAHAARRYQALRHFDDAPQLPSGYAGMFLLAYVPPVWFAVMNPRLLRAVENDPARINFAPGQREALCRQYGLRLN